MRGVKIRRLEATDPLTLTLPEGEERLEAIPNRRASGRQTGVGLAALCGQMLYL